MKIPFLDKKKPVDMTEAELEAGIQRCDKTLRKWPNVGAIVAHATIFAAPLGGIIALAAGGWVFTPLVLPATLGSGFGTFFGLGYAYKGIMTQAQQRREGFFEALTVKVEARQAAEAEAERLRIMTAEDKFNAAVNAGLPLENSISVRKALRLKFPAPPMPDHHNGFARVMDIFRPSC